MPTLPLPSNPSPDALPSLCDTSGNQRTVWNIVWSCLVTIFACTWLAIHPNIPAASDSRVIIALRRLGLMICMLIIPEIIILWAMRQWYGARQIAKAHRGWTSTHGFFLQMGGFMLYARGGAIHPLQLEDLERLHKEGDIDWPTITKEEIQDRSKDDALSKGIVILQTSWFVVQCIMRGIKGLVITELELVTLAFAALNTVTYFFWWNKPVDVRWPLAVHRKSEQVVEIHFALNGSPTTLSRALHSIQGLLCGVFEWIFGFLRLRDIYGVFGHLHSPATKCLKFFARFIKAINGEDTRNSRVPTLHATKISPDPDIFFFMSFASSAIGVFFGAIHCIAWSFQFPSPWAQVLWRVSSLVITCAPLFMVVVSAMITCQVRPVFSDPDPFTAVSTLRFNASLSSYTDSDAGTLFDTIRCDLPTPLAAATLASSKPSDTKIYYDDDTKSLASNAEESTISYLGANDPPSGTSPLRRRAGALLQWLLEPYIIRVKSTPIWIIWIMCIWMVFQRLILVSIIFAYVIARITLLIQALMALRSISPSALEAVDWTSFLPHF